MRIRWQSFIDPGRHREYFELLESVLGQIAGAEVTYEPVGIGSPATDLHRLTETRSGVAGVLGAIGAEREGYDAFVIGHFQDSGLHDARSAVRIPVLGLGEASMLHACTLGQRIGLVAISPVFEFWFREQIARYGLSTRIPGVASMSGLAVADYVRACSDDDALRRVVREFERAAAPLVAAGAEVLIPAGGLPGLALFGRPDLEVGGAAVLNPVAVLAKHAEAAVALARLGAPVASRKGAFALASLAGREEFEAAFGT
jgi:Asp/Glu/hydantoin racemase